MQDELESKWTLFREATSECFFILDSELNFIEINKAALELFQPGTMKEDIVGKNMLEILPHTKESGSYDAHLQVIKTGKSYEIQDLAPANPYPIKANKHVNIKVFKVGDGVGVVVRDITDLKLYEQQLLQRELELEARARDLEEMNTALKVLLKRREGDKEELKKNMLLNIQELILPYLAKLKDSDLDRMQQSCVELITNNLDNITSPFLRIMSTDHLRLSPSEIRVADHIRQGKNTKEIADMLFLSCNTVDSYRKSIRKKLGVLNKKINLRTYLIALDKKG